MRPAIFLLAPLFLASSLLSQQECASTHDDGTIVTNVSTGGVPIAYRMTAANAMTISALELYTGKRAGTGTLSIYAHDPVNNTPTTIRGGKASYTQRIMEGWREHSSLRRYPCNKVRSTGSSGRTQTAHAPTGRQTPTAPSTTAA